MLRLGSWRVFLDDTAACCVILIYQIRALVDSLFVEQGARFGGTSMTNLMFGSAFLAMVVCMGWRMGVARVHEDGSVWLRGGVSSNRGRVELAIRKRWGWSWCVARVGDVEKRVRGTYSLHVWYQLLRCEVPTHRMLKNLNALLPS